MPAKKESACGEILDQIVLTDEQRKLIAKYSDRDIKTLSIVRLSAEEIRRLAPGIISATAVIMCW